MFPCKWSRRRTAQQRGHTPSGLRPNVTLARPSRVFLCLGLRRAGGLQIFTLPPLCAIRSSTFGLKLLAAAAAAERCGQAESQMNMTMAPGLFQFMNCILHLFIIWRQSVVKKCQKNKLASASWRRVLDSERGECKAALAFGCSQERGGANFPARC